MTRFRQMLYVIVTGLVTAGVLTGYYLWHRSYVQPFSCQANLVQHHPDETLTVWLNYTFDGKFGTLSMNGRAKSDPGKTIDRKISFRVERKDRLYLLTSEKNMTFPDDNVEDSWKNMNRNFLSIRARVFICGSMNNIMVTISLP